MKFNLNGFFIFYALTALIAFVAGNGRVHLFDWDEINFAECAREMLISGNYVYPQIGYHPFYEKPPLFFWLQVFCMSLGGINESMARLPNAIAGVLTLIILYRRAGRWFSPDKALGWPVLYLAGFLPFFYFKSGIIDPWFNLFIFLSLLKGFDFMQEGKSGNILLSAFFLSLAVLTKGPVAWLLSFVPLFFTGIILKKNIMRCGTGVLTIIFLSCIIPAGYFLGMYATGNKEYLREFLDYQIRLFTTEDSGHGGPFWYHIPVLFFGCFPASFFAIRGLLDLKRFQTEKDYSFSLLMAVSLIWTLLVFSLVKTKIVHYSSFCYYPLSWFAFRAWDRSGQKVFRSLTGKWIFMITTVLILIILISAVLLRSILFKASPYIHDATFLKNMNFLGKDGMWNLLVMITASLILTGSILYSFSQKRLPVLIFIMFSSVFFMAILFSISRVEILSQRGYIELLKSFSEREIYLETMNFKSYAYFFYGKRMPGHYSAEIKEEMNRIPGSFTSPHQRYLHWLIKGSWDKPVILFYKGNISDDQLRSIPDAKKISTAFGYDLIFRLPSRPANLSKSP